MKSLRDTPEESNERAQVGIGTLIVFIAMVLVAAIAAGVLINTAGFLQTQAEATGEESTAQVANNLNVISTTGGADLEAEQIDNVSMSVQLGAGSDAIDLEDATIEFLGDTAETLVHENVDDTTANFSTVGETVDDGETVLADSGDRIEIQIDLTAEGTGLGELDEGESATVIITTADGAQVTESLNVPNMLDRPVEDL